VELEASDGVPPWEVTTWAMDNLGVEDWLMTAVTTWRHGASMVVRTVCANLQSAPSPLLFVTVMEDNLQEDS